MNELSQIPAKELLATAKAIAMSCKIGVNSYEKAQKMAEPYLAEFNRKAQEIAKKYNKKFYKIGFTQIVR